jgi:hypothetical protein
MNKMNEKDAPKHDGLDEIKLRRLETYHKRTLRFLLYQLDDAFRLRPYPECDWLLLGCSLIELLRISDARSFEMIIQGITHGMVKSEPPTNPQVAAAMARSGMTDNKLFKESLSAITEASQVDGALSFGSKILDKGIPFCTLWSLKILWVSGKAAEHPELIDPALDYLEQKLDDLFQDSPELTAHLMALVLHYRQDRGIPTAERCLENLLERQNAQGGWDGSPSGLGIDGEVAAALLEAAPYLGRRAAAAAESWLEKAFNLDKDETETEWPKRFLESRSSERQGLWMDDWLKATMAAARYLADQRPGHNPAGHLLALSVYQDNMLVRTEEMLHLARPYLPDLPEIQKRAPLLNLFWNTSTFEKSVYILYGGEASEQEDLLVDTLKETLWAHGLLARHLREGGPGYSEDPSENAAVYMTGCKYGIILLLDDKKGNDPDPALAHDVGFMRGQGARLLVLRDKNTSDKPVFAGCETRGFDPSEEGLAGLRDVVGNWSAEILEK